LAAIPKGTLPDSPVVHYAADQHGSLQHNRGVLDEIEGILTAKPVVHRAMPRLEVGVRTDPLVLSGEKIVIEASVAGGERMALQTQMRDEGGKQVSVAHLRSEHGVHRASFDPLPPGAYRVVVGGLGDMATAVAPVTTVVLVWSEGAA